MKMYRKLISVYPLHTMKSQPIYLDYNSTAPLALSARKIFLEESPYGNASSQHSIGKQALKEVNLVRKILFGKFSLDSKLFDLFFHSGATESVNTILNLEKDDCLIYYSSDHPCVTKLSKILEEKGVKTKCLKLDNSGVIDFFTLERDLENIDFEKGKTWLNMTWLHNETGVINSLDQVAKLKDRFPQLNIHVDAVQSIGKMDAWNILNSTIDAYTYSGHKFGSLKGVGFSFIKKGILRKTLLHGGGQQSGMRAGTLNTHGILSLERALAEVDIDSSDLIELKRKIIELLKKSVPLKIIENDSWNTICFIHPTKKADEMLIHFDLAGLCVSSGSACSSGSIEASQTLLDMGLGELAKNSIRISLGKRNLEQKDELLKRLSLVLQKL